MNHRIFALTAGCLLLGLCAAPAQTGPLPPPPGFSWDDIVANGSLSLAINRQQQMAMYLNTRTRPAVSQLASNGFGDEMNSYAWSMASFKGDLFVGTGRYPDTFQAMWMGIWSAISTNPIPHFPDAPELPYIQEWGTKIAGYYFVTNPANYELWKAAGRAEIWRLHKSKTKPRFTWSRVYQTPLTTSILQPVAPDTNSIDAAETMGFRSMIVFEDATKASALFAFSGGFTFARTVPLMYRTVDGTNWTAVATPLAMGRETRASTVHSNRLYVGVSSTTAGVGVWCTETCDPAQTNWVKVLDIGAKDPDNTGVISLISFNGKLYVGTENGQGCQVWCGSGIPGLDDWTQVIADGATDRYNAWAGTMAVFKKNLYVGTMSIPWLSGHPEFKGFDIIRIRPDNTWELVVGGQMEVDPAPGTEGLRPTSGWASGFGNPLNFYCWNLCVFKNRLYLGTFDASVMLRYLPYLGPLPPQIQEYVDMVPSYGGSDLWQTGDGKNWRPITLNGYGDPSNYGVRTMTIYEKRLMIGMANPFEGCQVKSTPKLKLQ